MLMEAGPEARATFLQDRVQSVIVPANPGDTMTSLYTPREQWQDRLTRLIAWRNALDPTCRLPA